MERWNETTETTETLDALERERWIADAAEALDTYGEDELERFALELARRA